VARSHLALRRGLIRIRRPFYGWYIVGIAFICLFIQASTGGFTFGIFLPAMSEDLGWSRSTIVVGSSLLSITAALAGPLLGRIVDQRGPRTVLVICILLMGIAQFSSGLVTEPWQFYLTFGLLGGFARSALQSSIPGAMIAQWFVRRRSTAYSAAAMGPPVAKLLLPPLIAFLVAVIGWRLGWMSLGLLAIVVGLPPALFLVRRRPEDLGLQPDGDQPPDSDEEAAQTRRTAAAEDWTAREAIHSSAFWLITAGMALILLAPNISIVFLFSYLGSQGMAASTAAVVVGAVSAMQVVSRLLFWLPITSRIPSVRWMVLLWGSLLLCASMLLALGEGEMWSYIAAGVLGIGLGGNLVLQLQIWPEYFGRTAVGTIIGTAQLLQGTTNAVGPLALAALLDHTGSYRALYLIVSALVLLGLLIHVVVGRPRRPAARGRSDRSVGGR
jgi:sugar phosphate permease